VDPLVLARGYLDGGARIVQLRAKAESGASFLHLGERLAAVARECGARLIINDRADFALLSGADGVHVGQDDLAVEHVRRIVGPRAIVGLSTHTPAQVDSALTMAISYLAVGPIFPTGTKDTGYTARGLELVRAAAGRGKPVVAIGGITLTSAAAVLQAGATSVAVISDLMAGDPAARVRQYLRALA
jgi:thiamine-phosphate pyrophosphorylase